MTKDNTQAAPTPRFSDTQERMFLAETLRLARVSVEKGSSPVGAIMVNAQGEIIGRGRNRTGEAFDAEDQRPGNASLAHAEMDLYFQLERLSDPETLTLYTSLEPCLMCGGASALLGVGRVVWATDDAWGGSGRLIRWDDHPAMQKTEVRPHPFADLEREGALLFAPEAKRAFPEEGWKLWQERYPEETKGL
ncbi:nucleoside deaminase (plasmid) [Deinococcus sp. KNUC1210]|uniref:nucleoside deaminase n=1 Tax=Deinococcus sp. KNUC1210 TaxID=2917691 RepID=UPI001EF000E3|nr:nucleoside deaminase [Deinococcus sp. KNUC1210]ULH17161.1 nucleoside deaminase [Deinococcus sp. KNUC1210]